MPSVNEQKKIGNASDAQSILKSEKNDTIPALYGKKIKKPEVGDESVELPSSKADSIFEETQVKNKEENPVVLEKVDNIPARSGRIDETDTFSENRTIQEVAYEGVKAEAAPKVAVAEPDEFSAVPSVQEQAKAQQQVFPGESPLYKPPSYSKTTTTSVFTPYLVTAISMIYSLSLVQRFLEDTTKERIEKEKENEVSFIVNTRLPCFSIKLGDWVVATENCGILNEDLEKHPKVETFMVGQIIGIINEMIYEVLVEVYPNKKFVFKSDMNFITPFVSCDTFKNRYRLPKPSREDIKKYYNKIKKSKLLKKIGEEFLKPKPSSK